MAAQNPQPGGARSGRIMAEARPHCPAPPQPPKGAPNILLVLFDDAGFSDFGSPVAAEGLRPHGYRTCMHSLGAAELARE